MRSYRLIGWVGIFAPSDQYLPFAISRGKENLNLSACWAIQDVEMQVWTFGPSRVARVSNGLPAHDGIADLDQASLVSKMPVHGNAHIRVCNFENVPLCFE